MYFALLAFYRRQLLRHKLILSSHEPANLVRPPRKLYSIGKRTFVFIRKRLVQVPLAAGHSVVPIVESSRREFQSVAPMHCPLRAPKNKVCPSQKWLAGLILILDTFTNRTKPDRVFPLCVTCNHTTRISAPPFPHGPFSLCLFYYLTKLLFVTPKFFLQPKKSTSAR